MSIDTTIVPIVGKIHWNDLTHLFELKVTFELDTPLGHFRKEVKITEQTLADAIGELMNIWAGHSYNLPTGLDWGDWGAVVAQAQAIETAHPIIVS